MTYTSHIIFFNENNIAIGIKFIDDAVRYKTYLLKGPQTFIKQGNNIIIIRHYGNFMPFFIVFIDYFANRFNTIRCILDIIKMDSTTQF